MTLTKLALAAILALSTTMVIADDKKEEAVAEKETVVEKKVEEKTEEKTAEKN